MKKLLKSFAYNSENLELYALVAYELERLRGYYYFFNSIRTDEALSRAYSHAISCYSGSNSSEELVPYLKSLAKVMMLTKEKDIVEEDIEQLAIENSDVEEQVVSSCIVSTAEKRVSKLLLHSPRDFIKLGYILSHTDCADSLMSLDSCREFRKQCLSTLRQMSPEDFIDSVKYLYTKYKDDIEWFLDQSLQPIKLVQGEIHKSYRKTSERFIEVNSSKRVKIVNGYGKPVSSANIDISKCYISGSTKGKVVCRVYYYELLNQMLLKTESTTTNELTLVIGSNRLIRTCSGTVLPQDCDFETVYDEFFLELLTNIIGYSGFRLLNYCSDYIYLIGEEKYCKESITLERVLGFGNIELPIERVEYSKYGD